jgi:hypothetical protein
MTTHVENRLEIFCLAAELAQLMCVLPQRLGVFEELGGYGVVLESFDGRGVEWSFAALWRCDYDLASTAN